MSAVLHAFPRDEAAARQLAAALGIPCARIDIHAFPDGESRVRIQPGTADALLYCSLDDPDAKLVRVLLAAAALRDGGAGKVTLVAPYLGYMRQDIAFVPGEAVSQRVIGRLIAAAFDALVTVDPHLHRTPTLEQVVPGIAAVNVAAAPAIAAALAGTAGPDTVLVGPDEESLPWTEALARPLGLEAMTGRKVRHGDRSVELVLPGAARVAGRPVILVDDVISTGTSLLACAARLHEAGAASVGAVATHCLADAAGLARLAAGGIAPLLATNSVPGAHNTIALGGVLAAAIRERNLA